MTELKTIYIGGGNPGASSNTLSHVHTILEHSLNLSCIKEYTVESNPVSINADLINVLKGMKCNRVSLGIQSFNEKSLLLSNRRGQGLKTVLNALDMLRDNCFDVSIDIINGLPGLDIEYEVNYLKKVLKSYKNINHLSFYDLSIDKDCYFFNNMQGDFPDEKQGFEFEKRVKRLLKKYKFVNYEVSNFCRMNKVSMHNLTYWKYGNYLGLGPAAHSTIGDLRIENKPDIDCYNNFQSFRNEYSLDRRQQIEEYVLMGLRLSIGINVDVFFERFNKEFFQLFDQTLKKYRKYFSVRNKNVFVNKKGRLILNKLLVEMFLELDDKPNI